jgi:hypothetical protein
MVYNLVSPPTFLLLGISWKNALRGRKKVDYVRLGSEDTKAREYEVL